MVAMNITQIEQYKEISDQSFSASRMYIFYGKNACDLKDIQIRYLVADSHHHAGFTNAKKVQDNSIKMYVFDVPTKREKHSEKTLAELYDPNKMHAGLREAHHNLDVAISSNAAALNLLLPMRSALSTFLPSTSK